MFSEIILVQIRTKCNPKSYSRVKIEIRATEEYGEREI
jgi:hypothetical protein